MGDTGKEVGAALIVRQILRPPAPRVADDAYLARKRPAGEVPGLKAAVRDLVGAVRHHIALKRERIGFTGVEDRFFLPIGLDAVERQAPEVVRRVVAVHHLDVHRLPEVGGEVGVILHHVEQVHPVRHIWELEVAVLLIREAGDFSVLPSLSFEHHAQVRPAVVRAAAELEGNVAAAPEDEGGGAHDTSRRRAVKAVMEIAVAGIGDILVPPHRFGVDAVVRERLALDDRPAGEVPGLEAAVFDLVRRGLRDLSRGARLGEERPLGLRVGSGADADVVHGEVAVIVALVLIDNADIDLLPCVLFEVQGVGIEVVGAVHAGGVLRRVDVILCVFDKVGVGLVGDHAVIGRAVDREVAEFGRRLGGSALADGRRAARQFEGDDAVPGEREHRRSDGTRAGTGVLTVEAFARQIPVPRLSDVQPLVLCIVLKRERLFGRDAVVIERVAPFDRPAGEIGALKAAVDRRRRDRLFVVIGLVARVVLPAAGGKGHQHRKRKESREERARILFQPFHISPLLSHSSWSLRYPTLPQ